MFLEEELVEQSSLRQGDIVSKVHLVGAINLNAVIFNENQGKRVGWQIPAEPLFGDAMIISHSCEIAPENKVKLTSIILAPLRDINGATDPAKVTELVQSNIITSETTASYLKYFYVEPNPKLEFQMGSVVDFSKCFSLRKNCYDLVLERKILQLRPEVAFQMARKLSLYFHRAERASKLSVA